MVAASLGKRVIMKRSVLGVFAVALCFGCAEVQIDDGLGGPRMQLVPDPGGMTGAGGTPGFGGSPVGNGGRMVPPGMGGMTPPRDAATPPPPTMIPVELAPLMADALCGYLERCDYATLVQLLLNEDCRPFMTEQLRAQLVERLQASVMNGMIIFDGAATQACLQSFGTLPCALDLQNLPTGCTSGFLGTGGPDDPCVHDEECGGSLVCNVSGACPGTCASPGAAGSPCSAARACAAGLSCVNGGCAPPAGQNENCGTDDYPPCDGGMYCDDNFGQDRGRCRNIDERVIGAGDDCGIQGGPFCPVGYSCIPEVNLFEVDFKCRPRVGIDQRCAPGLPEHCQDGLYCDGTNPSAQDIEGRCRTLPGENQPCGRGPIVEVCAYGLVCDSGTCSRRSALGGACRSEAGCYSGDCRGGACIVPSKCD